MEASDPANGASNDAPVAFAQRNEARHCRHRVVLDERDLLAVDNRPQHGHVLFAGRFNGTGLWLLRARGCVAVYGPPR